MTHPTRLETILKLLLQQKTGRLEPPARTFNDRVENLAYHLASEGVIVLVGDLHPTLRADRNSHLRMWMNTYAELYYLLTFGLFDISDEPVAYLADNNYPIVVVFEAKTYIVVRVMTSLILPYVALRQSDGRASRAELRGMIDNILDELAATDLPPDKYQTIRTRGIDYLETLLKSDIQQVSLTNFSREFLIDSGLTQTRVQHSPRPDSLPELPSQKPTTMAKPQAQPHNIIPLPKMDDEMGMPPIPHRNSMLNRLNRKTGDG